MMVSVVLMRHDLTAVSRFTGIGRSKSRVFATRPVVAHTSVRRDPPSGRLPRLERLLATLLHPHLCRFVGFATVRREKLMKSASVAALLITIGLSAAAAAQNVATEEFMIPAVDPGISLFVRNKHPVDQTAFPPGKILLFVHGATYPAETSFDLKLNGMSWMDYIARHGYDVYLVDVRGYGHSTRPPQMDKPPMESEPLRAPKRR